MGQALTVALDDSARHRLCKIEIKPWLFSRRKGSKNSELIKDHKYCCGKMDVHWDLSNARFGSGPEPVEGFYVAVSLDQEPVLLIGDLKKEAYKKIGGNYRNSTDSPSNFVFVSKKEHVFGKRIFGAKAQFHDKGLIHDVTIECGGGCGGGDNPCLTIRVDGKTAVQVKRLRWKFRGNHTILVDGQGVEVYWDVYNWLFGSNGDGNAAAVFMFHQTCSSSADKLWATSQSVLDSSVLTWSSSCSNKFQVLGFSLVLYAWKND